MQTQRREKPQRKENDKQIRGGEKKWGKRKKDGNKESRTKNKAVVNEGNKKGEMEINGEEFDGQNETRVIIIASTPTCLTETTTTPVVICASTRTFSPNFSMSSLLVLRFSIHPLPPPPPLCFSLLFSSVLFILTLPLSIPSLLHPRSSFISIA